MSFLNFLSGNDINAGIEEFEQTEGGVLIDVRTPEEFNAGHVPSAANIPLATLSESLVKRYGADTPLFVYCQSGARSSRATAILKGFGFSNVRNIGGIGSYHGEVVI